MTLTALSPFPLNSPADTDEPAAPAAALADAPAADVTTIDLLDTTDLHDHTSRIIQIDSGIGQTSVEDPGVVTPACEVFFARAANPNTLFASVEDPAGESAYISSILQDRPTMEALNAMSLDASALDNHELDQDLTDLETRILPASGFLILAANISGSTPPSAEGGGKGTFIKEVGDVRVGFVGVVTDEFPTLVSSSALSTLTLSPMVAVINARAAELKDGDPVNGKADVVVVLSYEDAAPTAVSFPKNVNAVFPGHTHVLFAKTVIGAEGDQIAVVQADHYGQALGRIHLSYDSASRETSVVGADNKGLCSSSCTTDAYGVAGIVSQAEKDSVAEGGEPLAKVGSDLLCGSDGSGPSASRGTEFTVSNLIAESFRSWLATDIQPIGSIRYVGIMNPSGVRADLLYAAFDSEGDGVLTSEGAHTVQPFGNKMAYTTLTGVELKTLLSQQWQPGSNRPALTLGLSRNVDVLIEATTDLGYGGEAGAVPAIRGTPVDGKPPVDGDSVVVTSNSLLLTGGDSCTVPEDEPVTNTGVLNRDVISAYLASLGDKSVTADYSKRQTATAVGPVYISPGGACSTDTVLVTLDSLAYTNPTEQAVGARHVRVSIGDKEILTKNLDLTVNPTGPITGRVDFNPTFPADTPTRACHTVQTATCRWALVETLDTAGTVPNRFSVEIEDEDAVGSGVDSDDSAATGVDAAASGADDKAASTPQSDPGAGETSMGGDTEPSVGSGVQPIAIAAPAASGVSVQAVRSERPNQAASDSPLALTDVSLSVGVLTFVLPVVGSYLILRRRQQVARHCPTPAGSADAGWVDLTRSAPG